MELTPEQMQEINFAFEILSREGDGSITSKDLEMVMKALGRSPTDAELQAMINEVDSDGNGSIEFHEFLHMITHKLCDTDHEEELREAFKIFDKDNSGYIGTERLHQVFADLGQKLTDEEIDEMIREYDTDQDGRISYDEFVTMMTGN